MKKGSKEREARSLTKYSLPICLIILYLFFIGSWIGWNLEGLDWSVLYWSAFTFLLQLPLFVIALLLLWLGCFISKIKLSVREYLNIVMISGTLTVLIVLLTNNYLSGLIATTFYVVFAPAIIASVIYQLATALLLQLYAKIGWIQSIKASIISTIGILLIVGYGQFLSGLFLAMGAI